ncbi:NUDIX domain-containing protein, partial [Saprospiraceae bacterium]|nr:NUDIX domain-containing protein [Saprospiraceae bacterium]
EIYVKDSGACILLYNPKQKTVILTRQFRLPTYLNGDEDGMMIEVCAGLLDGENPENCIIKETEEETGYRISNIQKIYESYMSPGAVTEVVHFFIAEYDQNMKVSEGGGLESEQEDIEVLEMQFDKSYNMISTGEITDAKTIMLLQYAKIHGLVRE